jgi:hypothetical protein
MTAMAMVIMLMMSAAWELIPALPSVQVAST